jgi:hypothetical protein
MMSNRGWLQPSSCPWLDRFSTVSGDMPDFGRILISPLIYTGTYYSFCFVRSAVTHKNLRILTTVRDRLFRVRKKNFVSTCPETLETQTKRLLKGFKIWYRTSAILIFDRVMLMGKWKSPYCMATVWNSNIGKSNTNNLQARTNLT